MSVPFLLLMLETTVITLFTNTTLLSLFTTAMKSITDVHPFFSGEILFFFTRGRKRKPFTEMERNAKIAVFFCGTDGRIDGGQTQISLFYKACQATELNPDNNSFDMDLSEYKMGFDGCGVVAGIWGGLFGYGLAEQCEQLTEKVARFEENGKRVTIVGLGLSRGAVALLMLTKLLRERFPKIRLDLVLFDPVPGNLIYQAKLDFLGLTNTSLSYNLSDCPNLRRVLLIYPYEPLPDWIFHAPLVPVFSRETEIECDVIPGCHQGAFYHPSCNQESFIACFMVREKLESYGLTFNLEMSSEGHRAAVMECLEDFYKPIETSTRYTHSSNNALIVRQNEGTYLNRFHEKMLKSEGKEKIGFRDTPYKCFVFVPESWC